MQPSSEVVEVEEERDRVVRRGGREKSVDFGDGG